MNTGPSGFHNAPVSKVVVIACGIASVLVGTQGGAKACRLSYEAVIKKLQFWRVFTSPFIFSSTPELIFGLYLMYYFRIFERQIGSNKYTVFLVFSTVLTAMFNLLAIYVAKGLSPLILSPGPYGLVFASFIQFYFDIPTTTRIRIFGANFSDKSFVYLAGLQLLLSSWKQSLIPGVCGLLAGAIYRTNVFGVRRVKFPAALASVVGHIFGPFFSRGGSPTSRSNSRRAQSTGGLQERFPVSVPSAPVMLPPPEESVATLVSMGFDRNRALQALLQARNDVTRATNILLEGQS